MTGHNPDPDYIIDDLAAVWPAGRSSTEAGPVGPEALTARQVELLQAIADGMSVKQSCRHLGIARKTAYNHLHSVHCRLGTQSQAHAVLAAVRLGLIRVAGIEARR